MPKDTHPLTETQRHWLGHVQKCESESKTLSAYAEEHKLSLTGLYNAKYQLKRRGLLTRRSPQTRKAFISVIPPAPTEQGQCYLDLCNGLCLHWDQSYDPCVILEYLTRGSER